MTYNLPQEKTATQKIIYVPCILLITIILVESNFNFVEQSSHDCHPHVLTKIAQCVNMAGDNCRLFCFTVGRPQTAIFVSGKANMVATSLGESYLHEFVWHACICWNYRILMDFSITEGTYRYCSSVKLANIVSGRISILLKDRDLKEIIYPSLYSAS